MKLLKDRIFIVRIRLLWTRIVQFFDILDKHHTFMMASGIAFTIIVYIIPLLLVAIFILSNYIDIQNVNSLLQDLFFDFLPPTNANFNLLKSIIEEVQNINKHSTFFGVIGIIGLLWISSALINSIRVGLSSVFEIKEKRIFILYRIKDIFLTILFAFLILVYSYGLPIITFLIDFLGGALPEVTKEYFSSTILFILSISTSFLLFYFVFRYVPNEKVDRKIGILSTAISVVGIEISRHIFAHYITSFTNYGKFYGTYAIIITLAIWIYYSALIILLSAELSNFIIKNKKT